VSGEASSLSESWEVAGSKWGGEWGSCVAVNKEW